MLRASSNVLGKILASKRQEVARLRREHSPADLIRAARDAPPARDFLAALRGAPGAAIIAEIKRRSPSAGALVGQADPAAQTRLYQAGGAAAISVLTDGPFFGGSLDDLRAVRAAVSLPLLCKDFIIDPLQVLQARAAGADAALLIAAALEPAQMAELYQAVLEQCMTPLVEVHQAGELPDVLALNPVLVGINNRDLRTLEVDLGTCLALRSRIPAGITAVAESGISQPEDVRRLTGAGFKAFLVGSALMQAGDPRAALHALVTARGS